ncbi:hypothetical protein [Streptomyces sp. NPDC003832]
MRYVDLDGSFGEVTGVIDPQPYLERLPGLAERLPPGARAFATDPGHYAFTGSRCVKDLRPLWARRTGEGEVELRFGHNCFKHEEDLVVRYRGVSRFQADFLDTCDVSGLGEVILDELLPHPDGCSHEVACRPGTLFVVCRDLSARWTPAECPEAAHS